MSATGTETTTEKNVNGRIFTTTITNITRQWTLMSPFKRRCIIGYGVLAGINYVSSTYIDAKVDVLSFRKNPAIWQQFNKDAVKYYAQSNLDVSEWEVALIGSRKNMDTNVLRSIVFPFVIASDLVPNVVLALNPPNSCKK
jgi:hypothetical protein